MAIIYRTAGAWGAGKGSNLTAAEVDENFYDHEGRIDALETNPPEPNEITNITISGTQITFHFADTTTIGPLTLPRAPFVPSVVATVATATYTPDTDDANGYIRCTNVAGCTVTIEAQSVVTWLDNTELTFEQTAAGSIDFTSATDVTINVPVGFLAQTGVQYGVVTLKRVAEDVWTLIGNVAEDVTA